MKKMDETIETQKRKMVTMSEAMDTSFNMIRDLKVDMKQFVTMSLYMTPLFKKINLLLQLFVDMLTMLA